MSARSFSSTAQVTATARTVGNWMCLLGCTFLLVYGFKSHLSGMVAYAYCLYGFAAFSLGSYVAYRIWGNWRAHRNALVLGFGSLYLFLLASGGEENTGMLWCYAFPLIVFTMLGPVVGAAVMGVMIALSMLILYHPELVYAAHTYTMNEIYRFSGSILFVSALAYAMERSRMDAQIASDKATHELRQLVRSDELTETFNRRGIKEKVRLELHRVARDQRELSLVLCDIDLFKRVNDQYGHDVGDKALRHVATLLKENVRVIDAVGRWGGEEFLILLPDTSMAEGYQLIERIRQTIARSPLQARGQSISLSISCGISSTRFHSRFDDLLRAADVSLYEAKAEGRNCTRPQVLEAG
ncbi:MAG: GGDEF domain-containing protein [Oleiphilaceae bacterium]|nr:GGDEF domain-containing protein [Oleiphilaceae bacterium]